MKQGSMTFEELLEKIIKEMPQNVLRGNEEEVEIKKILYVYIKLGQQKSLDERVIWGDGRAAYDVVQESRRDCKNLNILATKRKLTCISIAHLYKEILNRLGIECEERRGDPPDVHVDNVIVLKNGRGIFADLQLDLYNIQTKRKLEFFRAIGAENFLNENILNHFLMEIGYIFDSNSYRNNKIEITKKRIKMKKLPIGETIANIMGDSNIFGGMQSIGVAEAYIYYKSSMQEILDKEKYQKVYGFPCYVSQKRGQPQNYTFCIFADTGNSKTIVPYLYSVKRGRMLACSLENLEQLQEEGLQLGTSRLTGGVIRLKKYMKQAKMGKEYREKLELER